LSPAKPPLDLYFAETPNGWKVSICLAELDLPYKIIPVALNQSREPGFLKVGPNGRIPALVDRGADRGEPVAIFESGAILLYLAEKTGRLMASDLAGRYAVVQWLMWQMAGLGPMAGQNGHFMFYAPYPIPYALERYGKEVQRLYAVLDRQLSHTRAFVAGDYSIADIACFPWIMTHKKQGLSLVDYPHLQRWFAEIRARPQVQRGLAAGGGISMLRSSASAHEQVATGAAS
jgi:GST-like protein